MQNFRFAIPNQAGNWRAQDSSFKRYFGLAPKAKWPADGMLNEDGSTKDVFVQGSLGTVRLWVNPEPHVRTFNRAAGIKVRKSSKHRLQCQCPQCGAVMSGGRLEQHAKVHTGLRKTPSTPNPV